MRWQVPDWLRWLGKGVWDVCYHTLRFVLMIICRALFNSLAKWPW